MHATATATRPHAAAPRAPAPAPSPARGPETTAKALLRPIGACACGGRCPRCLAKSAIGSPDDPLEREADRVADRVMRMAEAPVRPAATSAAASNAPQRRCASCEVDDEMPEEETLRREPAARAIAPPAGVPASVRQALAAPGRPLDAATRGFFEPRFGLDLAGVRVHTGAAAERSATDIAARAYTVGADIVFAAGEYAPGGAAGRHLLAHELAHVVQQSHGVRRVQRAWNACGSGESCPEREPGETVRARAAVLSTGTLESPEHGIIVQPFAIGSSNASSLARDPTWLGFRREVDTRSVRWEILGFSDCRGDEALNRDLRDARATAVLHQLPSSARAKVDAAHGAPTGDCVSDDATEADRALNRSAVFIQTVENIDFPDEPVTAPTCPPTVATTAGSIGDYLSLVLCAESLFPSFSPREMLSLLRQLYYGNEAWSRTRTRFWENVIPCGLSLADPRPTLGAPLFDSLRRSQVVAGVDIGHVFTGLEAMVCPSASVELETPGPNAMVAISNEAFATWGGDLGSAAARKVHDEVDLSTINPWSTYFGTAGSPASHEDLEGDIDSFAIRAGLSGSSCAATPLTTLPTLSDPVSKMLLDYYDATPAAGAHRADYARCVVQALGGRVVGRRITNKADVVDAIRPGVESFARTFYLGLVTVPLFAIGVTEAMLLFSYSHEACELFVDWLESKL